MLVIVDGCLDDQKFNFEASVNTDDGTCVDFIFGCKDPRAFNYEPTANCGGTDTDKHNLPFAPCPLLRAACCVLLASSCFPREST